MSLSFRDHAKVNVPVESVAGVVSVKSRLDKNGIYEALQGLATIPQIDNSVLSLGALVQPLSEYVRSWPSLVVFGFEGVGLETAYAHVVEFYAENKVPLNRQPRAIIVNRQYILQLLHYEGAVMRPPVVWSKCTDESVGMPLFWLLAELGKAVSWLDGMRLDYGPYFSEAYPPNASDRALDWRSVVRSSPALQRELLAATGMSAEQLNSFPTRPPK